MIIFSQGKVLCLERADEKGFWQSVTGSVEAGEQPQACAKRELWEETGLDEGMLRDCETSWWFDIYPNRLHRYEPGTTQNLEHVFTFECPRETDVRLSNEHTSAQWLSVEKAIELVRSPTNKKAIQLFINRS